MKLKTVNGITELGNEASHNVLLKIGLNHTEDYVFEAKDKKFNLRWYHIDKE